MQTIPSDQFPIFIRAFLMIAGAMLLWAAPVSAAGLVVMLVGLVCAVCAISGLTLEKTQQF